jgi:hypothetical protein
VDFTLKTYRRLLDALIAQDYTFQTFAEFLENPANRTIILRHDVDARPANSLLFAQIQHELGVSGSYYFRMSPQSYNEDIIKQIAELGHEIGYHYETLDTCNGDVEKAHDEFRGNLEKFRTLVPVRTICMHGSPLSRYDNKDLWNEFNYKHLGIIGEPYFDLDFKKVLYLTDTGRRWDGEAVSVRDKTLGSQFAVRSSKLTNGTGNRERGTGKQKLRYTRDIISSANVGLLPDQIMMTFHPQRWSDSFGPWLKELVMQNAKNVVKRWIVQQRA